MKPLTLLTLALAFARPAVCGAVGTSRHEALVKETIKATEDLGDVLESVKDRDTAKAAAVKIDQIGDRLKQIRKAVEALPNVSDAESAPLQKYLPQVRRALERAQRLAYVAGKASGREPTFVKAGVRLHDAVPTMPTFADDATNRPDPKELYAAARLLSHVRGNPAVRLDVSLDEQAKILDGLLRSANPSIRAAAGEGRLAIQQNRVIDKAFANAPLEDFLREQIDRAFKNIADDSPVLPSFRDFKKAMKAYNETRKLEDAIDRLVTVRDNAYRGIFESRLLPLARALAGPPLKAPPIDIRSGLQPIRDAVNPRIVLGSRPTIQVVNIHGKKLENVVLEVEIEALDSFVDKRYFFISSLNKGVSYELGFGVLYHKLLGPPAPTVISYSLWCGDGCDVNQTLAGRSRLTWGQLKAARRSKEGLLTAVESRATFRGEIKPPKGAPVPVEFKLERVKKGAQGAADIQATLQSRFGVSRFEGYLEADGAGGFRLAFLSLPYNLASTPANRYFLSVRDNVFIFRAPTGQTVELRSDR